MPIRPSPTSLDDTLPFQASRSTLRARARIRARRRRATDSGSQVWWLAALALALLALVT